VKTGFHESLCFSSNDFSCDLRFYSITGYTKLLSISVEDNYFQIDALDLKVLWFLIMLKPANADIPNRP